MYIVAIISSNAKQVKGPARVMYVLVGIRGCR